MLLFSPKASQATFVGLSKKVFIAKFFCGSGYVCLAYFNYLKIIAAVFEMRVYWLILAGTLQVLNVSLLYIKQFL